MKSNVVVWHTKCRNSVNYHTKYRGQRGRKIERILKMYQLPATSRLVVQRVVQGFPQYAQENVVSSAMKCSRVMTMYVESQLLKSTQRCELLLTPYMRWEAASQAITLGHVWLVALRAVYHPACLLSLYRRAKNKESHPLPKVETCAKSKAPTKWGWSMSNNGVYEPTYTTQPSLTDKFDCLVSCKCRGPCKPPCRCCVRQQLCLPLCACRGCVGASQ